MKSAFLREKRERHVFVRIRLIRKPPHMCIDGVDVDRFEVRRTCEAGSSVGALFFSEGSAVPAVSDDPALITPLSELMVNPLRRLRMPPIVTRSGERLDPLRDEAEAADAARTPRRRT
jgi:hypothetical protein